MLRDPRQNIPETCPEHFVRSAVIRSAIISTTCVSLVISNFYVGYIFLRSFSIDRETVLKIPRHLTLAASNHILQCLLLLPAHIDSLRSSALFIEDQQNTRQSTCLPTMPAKNSQPLRVKALRARKHRGPEVEAKMCL